MIGEPLRAAAAWLAGLLLTSSPFVASGAAAALDVPVPLRGIWAQGGRCETQHLHVAARSMTLGTNDPAPVRYVAVGAPRPGPGLTVESAHEEIHWSDPDRTDFFLYDPLSAALVHISPDKPAQRWPIWTDVYQRCRTGPDVRGG